MTAETYYFLAILSIIGGSVLTIVMKYISTLKTDISTLKDDLLERGQSKIENVEKEVGKPDKRIEKLEDKCVAVTYDMITRKDCKATHAETEQRFCKKIDPLADRLERFAEKFDGFLQHETSKEQYHVFYKSELKSIRKVLQKAADSKNIAQPV